MSEDPTKDLTTDEMLRLILGRLDKLEAQSTGTTRPLLDQLVKEMIETREALTAQLGALTARIDTLTERMSAVETELGAINNRLDIFSIDISKLRGSIRGLDTRLAEVENRPY